MILCGAHGRPRRIIYKLNIIKKILFGFCIWSSAGGVDEYKNSVGEEMGMLDEGVEKGSRLLTKYRYFTCPGV